MCDTILKEKNNYVWFYVQHVLTLYNQGCWKIKDKAIDSDFSQCYGTYLKSFWEYVSTLAIPNYFKFNEYELWGQRTMLQKKYFVNRYL